MKRNGNIIDRTSTVKKYLTVACNWLEVLTCVKADSTLLLYDSVLCVCSLKDIFHERAWLKSDIFSVQVSVDSMRNLHTVV